MARRSLSAALARALCLLAACVAGCRGCGDDGSVGELLVITQRVDRDFGDAVHAWRLAQLGDRFSMGDGLRTGPSSTAQLALARGGRLLVQGDTIIRFTRRLTGPEQGRRIEVETGEILVETGGLDVGIGTARGVVKLAPSSQVKVRAAAGQIRFDVLVGRAEFDDPSGPRVASAGRGFDVTVLPAVAEPAPPAPPPDAPGTVSASAAAAEAPDEGAGSGPAIRNLRFQDAPPSATFTLPVGEHANVHDPLPPTDLRILVSRCPALAVVEFDRGNGRFDALRGRGTGEVRVRVPAGNYRYRVRCVRGGRLEGSSAGSGRVSVIRDVATRPLPSQPVAITADADGRRYTVSYQNRLPVITLRWPDAPVTSAYTLTVTPERGQPFTTHSAKPSVTLAAGRLAEGTHGFRFEGGGKRSEPGLLRVAFDYKARTAYLTSPVEGQRAENASTRVAGASLIGSSVQVLGVPMKLDSQGRFAAEVPVPGNAKAFAVRVQHPSTGIHYYVRHLVRGENAAPGGP